VLDVSEIKSVSVFRSQDLVDLGRIILRLAPSSQDDAARIGLIHVALNCSAAGIDPAGLDGLGRLISEFPQVRETGCDDLGLEEARVISLAFSIYAGDCPDPTDGASLVLAQDMTGPKDGYDCTALLGNYLFFKKSSPF